MVDETRCFRSVFRPCIDLHEGKVKQIVGGSLTDDEKQLKTNFVASKSPAHFASLYHQDNLTGGHVIKLGPNNEAAAEEALSTWPGGLQIGGGITIDNANEWLSKGASKVIVTSWLFPSGVFSMDRLRELSSLVGPECLVIDLSCRRKGTSWNVAINRWQTVTDMKVNQESLERLSKYASEFLVHAADVEGLCQGIDQDLVKALGEWSPVPCTYAGGGRDISDLALVNRLSNGRVDITFGSFVFLSDEGYQSGTSTSEEGYCLTFALALDIFGGRGVRYSDCVAWNKQCPR